MTPSELADLVTARYPDARRIGDSIVQFTRRVGSRPFAVYYLDCGAQIPASLEELRAYQDRVIGQRYFEGAQSLQWNNYIYFIASPERLTSNATVQIRELLEQDRSYARKFLIEESELNEVLQPDVVSVDPTTETSVLSIWNNALAQAGIGRAIWSDSDMPRRLTLLETTPPVRTASAPTPSSKIARGQWLSRLQLKTYRDYPLLHNFDFGTVNLIYGPNASGKTSLLEAIELFYCGRNKRSPDSGERYDLSGTLADGTVERATNARAQKVFRQRNLSWYGQLEVKKNDLYLSFARFNFLDTDAAVRLAKDTENHQQDLSKLLIGSDAAKTWENMSKVLQHGRARLKVLRDNERRLQQLIAEIDAVLQSLTDSAVSDLVRHRLLTMLQQQNWKVPTPDSSDELAAKLIGPLIELVALARQATALPLSPTSSRNTLARFIKTATTARDKGITDIASLEALERQIATLSTSLAQVREASNSLDRVRRLVAAGVPTRIADRDRLRQTVAQLSDQLVSIDSAVLSSAAAAYPAAPVAAHLARMRQARAEAANTLQTLSSQYASLRNTRTRSANLAEELRGIARQYLTETTDESECPLCHTRFKPGELVAHINKEISKQLERSEEELATRVHSAEEAARRTAAEEVAAAAAAAFAQRAELGSQTILAEIAMAFVTTTNNLAEQTQRLSAIEGELQALDRQGIRWADLDPLRVELVRRRFPVNDWSNASVAVTAQQIAKTLTDQERALAEYTRNAERLKQQLNALLGATISSSRNARIALTGLEQQIAVADTLAKKIETLAEEFRIPLTKALGELAVEADAICGVAQELQNAVQQERETNAVRAQSTARRAQLDQEALELAPKIKTLAAATGVLQRLQREHSLSAAMKGALQRNRGAIESIFAQIHAPHEFAGLGETITELRRRNGTISNLAQISTGQRAALGLSIFLAQNMKLRDAPPVILMDDPIAHVDDLNCLAFLDYLREIALSQRRQIFFATANDKLAAIFGRKFDFLGQPEFRRIELHRESPPPVATVH